MNTQKSSELFNRAKQSLSGGVNSPVRAFKAVGGEPLFIASATGCTLTDVDSNEYIDYIGSWGPMILGHNHPEITQSLQQSIAKGISYGAPCPAEVDLAEIIIERVPALEMVRFVNSGTEATMSAIRLARAATGRDRIIKFAGCYHGHADSFLIQAGSGVVTFGAPDSPGVTAGAAKDTVIAEYNNLESVEVILKNTNNNIAAIIIEPIAGNMGVIPPADGFLQGLRVLCDKYGALLIFDEVMTGFRVHAAGAQGLYDIKPDLSTFGKIIGGGMPVGAYGGSSELMNRISPAGDVYQAGTLSGNPLAMTAGIQTFMRLNDDVYERIENMSAQLEEGINKALRETDTVGVVQRVGSMLTLFFGIVEVTNFRDAKAADHELFAKFFNMMLERGVHLPPSGYESWFISTVHSKRKIDETIQAVRESLLQIE